jgi:ribosomal protein L37AE/L43A
MQSKTLVNLRDSSRIAEQKVSTVVDNIERTLSSAVPGFKLEPSAFAAPLLAGTPSPLLETPGSGEIIKAEPQDVEEIQGKYGFCPKCTSTRIRRANRVGIWEEFLRLFFIAPFRCRSCRHKFYRF